MVAILASIPVVAPLADATHHMTLYVTRTPDGESVDPGQGRIREDDGEVARQPGGDLDGIENKVSLNASESPGDGSLLLDARFNNQHPAYWDGSYILSPVTGREQMMFGSGSFMAWYGWWKDLDNDSRVNDFHDTGSCPITYQSCAGQDEFKWRGAAIGAALTMVMYFLPNNLPANTINHGTGRFTDTGNPAPRGQFGAWQTGESTAPDVTFDDRTELSEPQQYWVNGLGWPYIWTDESLLMSVQTIVAANARRAGGDVQYDLKDPAASIDVDEYESINGDLESMWTSNARAAREHIVAARALPQQIGPMVNGYIAQAQRSVQDTQRQINNITAAITPIREGVEREVGNVTGPFVREATNRSNDANRRINPLFLKEPNNAGDEYPGATFSGTPTIRGIGNDYSAHEAAYHFFMDATTFHIVPFGPNVIVEPLNTGPGVYNLFPSYNQEPLPCDSCGEQQRGLGPGFFAVQVLGGLWLDKNADKWVGEVCDPTNSTAWDSTTGECANTALSGTSQQWGDTATSGEVIGICGQTTLNGGGSAGSGSPGVKIRPVPGYTWEDAGLVKEVRWFDRPTYNVWNLEEMTQPTGTEVVELEFAGCMGTAVATRTNDALFLAEGTLEISVIIETTARMTASYVDQTTGLTVAPETATDVDVYLASM